MLLFYGFLIGSFMGLITHAKRNGKIVKPHNKKRVFEYGFLLDMIFGGVAALAFVTLTQPTGLERLILTSVLAGYGGEVIVAKLEAAKAISIVKNHFWQIEKELNAELETQEKERRANT